MHEFWREYYGNKYRHFSTEERISLREKAREMFYFGYDSYMKFAFPKVWTRGDEITKVFKCRGDYEICGYNFRMN